MLELGLQGIGESPSSPADPYIYRKVMSLAQGDRRFLPAVIARLCRELNPYLNEKGCDFVIREVEAPRREKVAAVVEALREEIEQPAWPHVWLRLVELAPADGELQEVGRGWLDGREDRPEWNYVWQRLVELNPFDRTLHLVAEQWLRHKRPAPAANAVRKKLVVVTRVSRRW